MRPIPGTITDPATDVVLGLAYTYVPEVPPTDTFEQYQGATEETAVYPRVYTEDQVREIVRASHDTLLQPVDSVLDVQINHLLEDFETPFNRLVYPVLGLLGEAGEIANKLKKVARDDQGKMDMDKSVEIQGELGDVLWYVARVATELNTPLERIAYANVRKLFSRKARGALGGSGDKR